ncbi:TetR/AcrR family transcriptional regulator [Paenibacillus alvei]|uniref:TetR/AcrR family transcriptional regulator n=1 Tax=Paenibacillus alvei TaxID=44250 RepID=UPI003AF2C0CE
MFARTDMNRSTFYYHFQDKKDLLQQSIQEMIKQAMEDVELHPAPQTSSKVNRNIPLMIQRQSSLGCSSILIETAIFIKSCWSTFRDLCELRSR